MTFLRVGYSAAEIDGISEEAGFSRGAFHAHFTSKEDVLLEALASQADEFNPTPITRIEAAASATEVIEILSRWVDQRSQAQDLAFALFEALQRGDETVRWTTDIRVCSGRTCAESAKLCARFFLKTPCPASQRRLSPSSLPCPTDRSSAWLAAMGLDDWLGWF